MAYEIIDEDERITLEETFGFRGGNTREKAIKNLEYAIKCNSIKEVPDNAIIYAIQTTSKRYEAYVGIAAPKKETTNSTSKIIHGDKLKSYIAGLPGDTLEEKLRNIEKNEQKGQISKRAAQAMIDTLQGYKSLNDKDKSLQDSLL